MTKMATMPIYGKTLQNQSWNQVALGLGMQHWDVGPTNRIQMIIIGLTFNYFTAWSKEL